MLLSDPNFLFIWLIGGLTGVIRWFQLLAFAVYTFETTGSPFLVSLIPILWTVPLPLFGPVVGVVADRVNRKLLLGGAMVVTVILSAVMAWLAYRGDLVFWHLVVASLVSGLFWAADMPVRRRLLGDLSGGNLSAAMSLDSATGNATRMAGPVLGGVMLEQVGMTGVFLLSGIIYAVCVLLLVPTRLPGRSGPVAAAPTFVRDLAAGLRLVTRDRNLRRIFTITIVFNMFGFPFTSMIPIIGSDTLGLGPFMVGVLSSLEGLGAFVGAIFVAMLARPAFFFRIYYGGTLVYISMIFYLSILSYVAGGPYHSFILASMTLTIIGASTACFAAMQGTLTYLAAPPDYRSRVLGVLTLCIGTAPIGFFNVGWMAEAFGVSTALLILSLEGLGALLLLWVFGKDNRFELFDQPEDR